MELVTVLYQTPRKPAHGKLPATEPSSERELPARRQCQFRNVAAAGAAAARSAHTPRGVQARPPTLPYALTNKLKLANREQATCVSRINRRRLFLSGKSSTITKMSSKNCASTGANVAIAVSARS